MNDQKIELIIEAQNRSAAALTDLQKQLAGTQKEASKASVGFKQLAGAFAGLVSAGAVVQFLRQSVVAMQEAQAAETRLAAITRTASGATEEQIDILVEQANALQRVTTLSAEQIMGAQAKLASFDLQTESIQRLIPALLDYTVAENGAAVSSETLESYANGLGKALQGQTQQLTLSGFKFDEQQKKLLETGTETERVTALTEILNSTYEGTAETMGQTFEGAMIRARNTMGDLQESIGAVVVQGLQPFMDEILNATGRIGENAGAMVGWQKAIYQVSNFIIGTLKVLKMFVQGLTALADVAWSVSKVLREALTAPLKALAEAIQGNFKEAKEALTAPFTEGFDEIKSKMIGWKGVLSDSIASAADSAAKAFDAEGFKPIEMRLGQVGTGIKKFVEEAGEDMEEAGKQAAKLGSEYQDFQEKADDALFDVKQSHEENMSKIGESIKGVRKQLRELRADYEQQRADARAALNESQADNTKTVAEQVIANEERIAAIQKELAGDVSGTRRTELAKELQERKNAITENASFLQSIEAQVNEARRIAGLSDLQRAIEEYQQKQAMAQADYDKRISLIRAEYEERKSALKSQLKDLEEQKAEEEELYEEKTKFILEQMIAAAQSQLAFANGAVAMTKEQVQKEIEYYEQLAKAIQAARSGNAAAVARAKDAVGKREYGGPVTGGLPYVVGENGPEIFTPATSGRISDSKKGVTIVNNFSNNLFMGERDLADMVDRSVSNSVRKAVKMA